MADVTKTIELVVSVIDHSKKAISSVSTNLNDVKNSAKKASASLNTATSSVKTLGSSAKESAKGLKKEVEVAKKGAEANDSLGRSLAYVFSNILAIVASIKGFTYPIKESSEFEVSMKRVAGVMGATQEEYARLTDAAAEMGKTTVFTAGQAADGLKLLAQAGFDTEQAIKALPDVLNLALAGGMELANATDYLTSSMYSMGLQVSDLSHVTDVLVNTFSSTNSNLSDLGEGLKYVGPIAASVGENIDELSATMGILANAGIKGSMAGTTLREAIKRLLNPVPKAKKAMEDLAGRIGQSSIKIHDASGNFVGMAGIIKQLEDASMSAGEAMEIFGSRAGPGMVALVQAGSDAIEELTKKNKEADGVAKAFADTVQDSVDGSLKLLKSALNGLFISLGDKLAPAVKNAADSFSVLFSSLSDLADEFPATTTVILDLVSTITIAIASFSALNLAMMGISYVLKTQLIVGITTFAGAIAETVVGITKMVSAFGLIEGASSAFLLILQGLNLPLIAIAGIITTIVGGLYLWITREERLKKAFKDREGMLNSAARETEKYADKLETLIKKEKDGKDISEERRDLLITLIKKYPELAEKVDIATVSLDDLQKVMKEMANDKIEDQIINESKRLGEVLDTLAEKELGESFKKWADSGKSVEEALHQLNLTNELTIDDIEKYNDASTSQQKNLKEIGKLVSLIELNARRANLSTNDFFILLETSSGLPKEIVEKFKDMYDKIIEKEEKSKEAISETEEARREGIKLLQKEKDAYKEVLEEKKKSHKKYMLFLKDLIDQGVITEKDAEVAKTKFEAKQAEDRYETAKRFFEEGSKLYDKDSDQYKQLQENLVKATKENYTARARLRKAEYEKQKDAYKQSVKDAKEALDKKLLDLKEAAEKGIKTQDDAEEEKIEIIRDYYKKEIKKAEENLKKIKEIQGIGVDAVKNAQTKVDKLKEESAKFELKQLKKVHDEKMAMLDANLALAKANVDKEKAILDQQVQDGLISEKDAADKKLEIEADYAQAKLNNAIAVFDDIANQYDIDTSNYKQALANKKEAEAEYIDTMNSIKKKREKIEEDITEKVKDETKKQKKEVSGVFVTYVSSLDRMKASYSEIMDEIAKQSKDYRDQIDNPFMSWEIGQTIDKLNEVKNALESVKDYVDNKFNVNLDISNLSIDTMKEEVKKLEDAFKNTGKKILDIEKNSENATKEIKNWRNGIEDTGPSIDDLNNKITDLNKSISKVFSKDAKPLKVDEIINSLDDITNKYQEVYDIGAKIIDNLKTKWEELDDAIHAIDDNLSLIKNDSEKIQENFSDWKNGVSDTESKLKDFHSKLKDLEDTIKNVFSKNNMSTSDVQDAINTVINKYKEMEDAGKSVIDELKSQWDSLAEKIKSINDQILNLQQDTQDAIRNLEQEVMNDEQKWLDNRKFYHETYLKAIDALNKGNYDTAVGLFKEAEKIAKKLAKEIKDNSGNVVSSLEDNTKIAIDLIQKAEKGAIDALSKKQDDLKDRQKDLSETIATSIGLVIDASKESTDALKTQQINLANQQKATGNLLDNTINKLDTINKRMQNLGNVILDVSNPNFDWRKVPIGENSPYYTPSGGNMDANNAFYTKPFSSGGLLGGRPHSQGGTIIEAEAGEFVEPVSTVKKYGVQFFEALRKGVIPESVVSKFLQPQKYAEGGEVKKYLSFDGVKLISTIKDSADTIVGIYDSLGDGTFKVKYPNLTSDGVKNLIGEKFETLKNAETSVKENPNVLISKDLKEEIKSVKQVVKKVKDPDFWRFGRGKHVSDPLRDISAPGFNWKDAPKNEDILRSSDSLASLLGIRSTDFNVRTFAEGGEVKKSSLDIGEEKISNLSKLINSVLNDYSQIQHKFKESNPELTEKGIEALTDKYLENFPDYFKKIKKALKDVNDDSYVSVPFELQEKLKVVDKIFDRTIDKRLSGYTGSVSEKFTSTDKWMSNKESRDVANLSKLADNVIQGYSDFHNKYKNLDKESLKEWQLAYKDTLSEYEKLLSVTSEEFKKDPLASFSENLKTKIKKANKIINDYTAEQESIQKKAIGGLLGGKPHSQGGTIIEAEAGEFIEPIKSVKKYGVHFFEALRQGVIPESAINFIMSSHKTIDSAVGGIKTIFADGGIVPPVPSSVMNTDTNSNTFGSSMSKPLGYYKIDLNIGGKKSSGYYDQDNVNKLLDSLGTSKLASLSSY